MGATVGTVLATPAGLSRLNEDAFDAPMQMLRTLPHLALVPLFILWFGIGELAKVTLVALGAVFPVYLNLFAAIRGTDPKLLEAGRVFGLGRIAVIRRIVLPAAQRVAAPRGVYAVQPMNDRILAQQQETADLFARLRIIPARIDVRKIVRPRRSPYS